MLDLERWDSVAEAVAQLSMGSRAFEEALFPYLELNQREADGAITMFSLFVMSTASRARGLHAAVIREIQNENPHAVFPIMRSLLETAALAFYVSEHPKYVKAVAEHPKDRSPGTPNRKSPQALVDFMDRQGHTGQLATVYRDLCEITHFGTTGMWAAYAVDGADTGGFSWTSAPRFRDNTGLIACGQLDELTTLMVRGMVLLGTTMLTQHGFRPAADGDPSGRR